MTTDIDFVRIDPTRLTLAGYSPFKAFDTSNPPARFQSLIEKVKLQDRSYFSQHPQVKEYRRAYCPGECWPSHLEFATTTLVVKHPSIAGIRARIVMNENPARARADQTAGAATDIDQNVVITNPALHGFLREWVAGLLKAAYREPADQDNTPIAKKGDALICVMSDKNYFKDLREVAAKLLEDNNFEVILFSNEKYGSKGFKVVNGEVTPL